MRRRKYDLHDQTALGMVLGDSRAAMCLYHVAGDGEANALSRRRRDAVAWRSVEGLEDTPKVRGAETLTAVLYGQFEAPFETETATLMVLSSRPYMIALRITFSIALAKSV